MPELTNSSRKLLRATYAPVPSHNDPSQPGRAFPKHAAIANLRITEPEFGRLRDSPEIDVAALRAIQNTIRAKGTAVSLDDVALFADVNTNSLVKVVEEIGGIRQQNLESARGLYQAILNANRSSANLDLRTALEWAVEHRIRPDDVTALLQRISHDVTARKLTTYEEFEALSQARIEVAWNVSAALKRNFAISPVGFLHLERLNFVPAGIERGELVYSVPLSPAEEVNISHKEWSATSEEFSTLETDSLEAYSEQGVSEKSELAQSTNSQEQHSFGFNTGVTASGGYGPVTISSSVGVNVASSATNSEQASRNYSSQLTRKASARSKKEHKTSFKVASAAGTEDQQVRKIKNPFQDKATRVDYYQLVRKWQVNLYRYGIRLTYDLMIPEPGVGILSKVQEIESTRAALDQGFGDATATQEWAKFDLKPGDIDRNNIAQLEAKYGVAVDPPKAAEVKWQVAQDISVSDNPDDSFNRFIGIGFEVPEDYQLSELTAIADKTFHEGHAGVFGYESSSFDHTAFPIPPDDTGMVGMTGKLTLVIQTKYVRMFTIQLTLRATLLPEAFSAWQTKAWSELREGAKARYEENRQNLKAHLSSLLQELGAQDPLSLRKIEREEVMKGVLRWMLGPGFNFSLAWDVLTAVDVPAVSEDPWSQLFLAAGMSLVTAQEEIIRFLHQAIEWENMLYFLYPYFWSHSSRWNLKKYLSHPDLMHRVFLKSGSARVVLTIRPGFETDFISFIETGKVGSKHPYLTIAEEMQAYANTNYPGIRPANPEEGARPLLYPEQRKAWSDMQKLIQLIEDYNVAQHNHNRIITNAITSIGTGTATPSSMKGIDYGTLLTVDSDAAEETVSVTATTATTFTASFSKTHAAGARIQIDPALKMYPATAEFPAAIQAFAGNAPLPLTDPWGKEYQYTSPGLNADYELVSYGADKTPEKDQTDPKKLADPLNADIPSWAEASLIGQWYEYTPTSALDIAFAEILPNA
jgi:hypothetical protein